jgi:hypothetical protein
MPASRLTTSDIIEKGDYLSPNFDLKKLFVSQLVGIFSYHEIPLPPSYNKAKLLAKFAELLRTNGQEMRQQHSARKNCPPSDVGIIDAISGTSSQVLPF